MLCMLRCMHVTPLLDGAFFDAAAPLYSYKRAMPLLFVAAAMLYAMVSYHAASYANTLSLPRRFCHDAAIFVLCHCHAILLLLDCHMRCYAAAFARWR